MLLTAVINGGGIYRSVDSGQHWNNILPGDATHRLLLRSLPWKLGVDPNALTARRALAVGQLRFGIRNFPFLGDVVRHSRTEPVPKAVLRATVGRAWGR